MADRTTTAPRPTDELREETDVEALREELRRAREEVLRLRDLLIARDAELGSAKGQLAQLEAGAGRLLGLVGRVRSLIPGVLWSALSALRRRGS